MGLIVVHVQVVGAPFDGLQLRVAGEKENAFLDLIFFTHKNASVYR